MPRYTHNDHMADVPTAEFRVRGILHVDDPAGDEDAQPCQEKVLHLNGWETTLWEGGSKGGWMGSRREMARRQDN